MRAWLSLSELAALALPDMPTSARGWAEFLARDGQAQSKTRARQGRGGGLEYHIDVLPPQAKIAYLARFASAAQPKPAAAGPGAIDRDARLAIMAAAQKYQEASSYSGRDADAMFCALYNLGKIETPSWVRERIKNLAPRSLARWRGHARFDKDALIIDRGAQRRGKGFLEAAEDGEIKAYILALIAHQPHLSARHVRKIACEKFPGLDQLSPRTFQHFLKALKAAEKAVLTRVTNPDLYRSKYRFSGVNAHAVDRLNEVWMIDASPADVLCVDGRHSLYVCIDIFSRRVKISISRTPRAQAVALLMRAAMLDWGVPECVTTDNGSDFTAVATQRLFAHLQIEVDICAAFSPEQKGHVERAIGTLQRDLMPLLPGFIGHNVKDRKRIEERKAFSARLGEDDAGAFCVSLTARDLLEKCEAWARDYATRVHSGLNMSPFAKAASYAGAIRRIADARALDLLLAPVAGRDGFRTVTKTGIKIAHSLYISTEVMPGDEVFVRMDPMDMGRAYLFSRDGESFLGEAICPALAGVDPVQAVNAAKKAQAEYMAEQTARLRADMKNIGKGDDLAEIYFRESAREAGKLVEFPRPSEVHDTPALQAAAKALGLDDAAPAPRQELQAPAPVLAQKVVALPETPQQRFRRARELEQSIARGDEISTEDAMWLGGYQRGAEYQAHQLVFEFERELARK